MTVERQRVRVAELRPGDRLLGSSRTVITTPGRDSQTRRRHVSLMVRDSQDRDQLVEWRADTLVYVLRPVETPAPRRDLDG